MPLQMEPLVELVHAGADGGSDAQRFQVDSEAAVAAAAVVHRLRHRRIRWAGGFPGGGGGSSGAALDATSTLGHGGNGVADGAFLRS